MLAFTIGWHVSIYTLLVDFTMSIVYSETCSGADSGFSKGEKGGGGVLNLHSGGG